MLLSLATCRTRSSVQQFVSGLVEQQRAMRDSETGAESYLDFDLGFGAGAGLGPSSASEFAPTSFLFLLLAPTSAHVQGVKENEKQTWHGKHLTVLRNEFYCP